MKDILLTVVASTMLYSYMSTVDGVSGSKNQIVIFQDFNGVGISLSSLKDKRLSNIAGINVFIDKRYTSIDVGRCYIDNFYFK